MINKNFMITQDDVLSQEDCNEIISFFKNHTTPGEVDYLNYEFCDVERSPLMESISKKTIPVIQKYKEMYKEVTLTASTWNLNAMRFKHFKPGYAFDMWHSENSITKPNRILAIQIYLSNHNCGTEFYNGDYVQSKIGRVVIFPAYFTHTHRGQKCPDNKDRYILTGYYNYINAGKLEYNYKKGK